HRSSLAVRSRSGHSPAHSRYAGACSLGDVDGYLPQPSAPLGRTVSAAQSTLGDPRRRAWWLKTLHPWHWISSALCLIGLLGFAITGITLNHASRIPASPQTRTLEAEVPEDLLASLQTMAEEQELAPLPPAV